MPLISTFESHVLAAGIRKYQQRFNLTILDAAKAMGVSKTVFYRRTSAERPCRSTAAEYLWVMMADHMIERLRFDPETEFAAARARLRAAWDRSIE